ncbi:hypothetical protein [Staphylococcus simulans]|uniref:hypothetical protein n=1 Tax=Staphylococcus simulans TaxID=1286 RepID=UPI001F5470E6|nr:hypothetical protein [Staphylococcus simulans]
MNIIVFKRNYLMEILLLLYMILITITFLKSEANNNGDIVNESKAVDNGVTTYAINKAALKWACIFSSYSACIGVSLGTGPAGAMVSGPFGAATGFAGGAACRYIFQTAVEKFGGKDAACKVLS